MPRLSIALLGAFHVSLDGHDTTAFRSDNTRSLLAYLAVQSRRRHRRSALAALFWPECQDDISRNNLRQTLYALRLVLSDREAEKPFLLVAQQDLQFSRESDYWLDIEEFADLLGACPLHKERPNHVCHVCAERLDRAVLLYRGEFLSGLPLPDSEAFEEWVRTAQEQYHQLALEALARLTAYHDRRREYDQVISYAQRQLVLEPWREEAHRSLMRAYALKGLRSAALRQYDVCCRTMGEMLGVAPAAETSELYEEILSRKLRNTVSADRNPYMGLHHFTEADATFFFGREAFVQRLLETVARRPLVAVIGPSGTGKSSAIFAGLLPRLAQRSSASGAERWLVVTCRPDNRPLHRLAAALFPLVGHERESIQGFASVGDLATGLMQQTVTLTDIADRIMACHPEATRLLLIADQFEEVFTLCGDPEVRQRFVDVMLTLLDVHGPSSVGAGAEPDRSRYGLVIGLRADFMGQALAYRPLADAMGDATLMLGPMSRQEMEQAIEEPARTEGAVVEPGLVSRLIDDLGEGPGHLPLLEFALTLLWGRQPVGVLTHAAYDEIGGVRGALAHYAEEFYARLNGAEQTRARRALLQMVSTGHHVNDTRRIVHRVELDADDWSMVQRLADARLVVTGLDLDGKETAEIVHETLISAWSRFQQWLDDDRESRLWRDRIRIALGHWEANGFDDGGLLRGAALAEAEKWSDSRPGDLDSQTQTFIAASQSRKKQELQALEAHQQRELTQARMLARAETRARQSLRNLAVGLAMMVLVAIVAVVIALGQQQQAKASAGRAETARITAEDERSRAETERTRAETQARLALARQLSAQANSLLPKQPDLALLLGIEANRLSDQASDRAQLLFSLRLSPYLAAFLQTPGRDSANPDHFLAFLNDDTSDTTQLTSVTSNGSIRFWDARTHRSARPPVSLGLVDDAGLALSPNGHKLAVSAGRTITVYDTLTGTPILPALGGHQSPVQNMWFSGDAQTLVSSGTDGEVVRWNLGTGVGTRLPETTTADSVWALSMDGTRLAMTESSGDGEYASIVVLDVATGRRIAGPLNGHKESDGIHSLAFSPDGHILASSSYDKTVILWDLDSGGLLHPSLARHTARALVTAFSPDGRILASGGADNAVILWDIASGKPIGSPLMAHNNWVRSLTFSSDGQTLASGSADGMVILWDIGKCKRLAGHTGAVRGVAFSPDGRFLATGGLDNQTIVYDLASGGVISQTLPGDGHTVMNVAFSPDGRLLATASASGRATLWDATDRFRSVGSLPSGKDDPLVGLAFKPDSRMLALAGFDKAIALWDVATQQPLVQALTGHSNWILSLAISPDGQTLVSGSADSTIRLWDATTHQPLAGSPLTGHTNWVNSVVLGPSGGILASASSDTTVRLWDVEGRKPLGVPLTGHNAQVWSVAFDPTSNGATLLSGDGQGTVIRWDVATHQPLGPPLVGDVEMETMAVSPDGQTVALGGFDSVVALWRLDTGPWTERACRIANRNLTPDEWLQYLHAEAYHKTCPDVP